MKNILLGYTFRIILAASVSFLLFPSPARAQEYVPSYKPKESELSKEQDSQSQQPFSQYGQDFGFGSTGGEAEEDFYVNQYDPKYKKAPRLTKQQIREQSAVGVLPNYVFAMYFVRDPADGPQDIRFRVMTPVAVTGCIKIKQPVMEITKSAPNIKVRMTSAEIRMDKSVRYAHFQCDLQNRFAYADILLNRDELISGAYRQLNLQGVAGSFSNISLDVNEHRIVATTKPMSPLNPGGSYFVGGGGGIATYWFYPENTIVLNVASREATETTRSAISDIAKNAGLTPLDEVYKDFTPDPYNEQNLYFVDTDGRFAKKMQTDKPVLFDTISASETFYGAQGAYEKPEEVAVFAKLPGVYD